MAATICADDYALDVCVSEAILDLFAQGAINATSCLVTSPLWADYGLKLKSQTPSHQANQYGLHINLTQGASLTGMQGAQWFCFKGVLPMIIACYLGCIKMEVIQAEITAQWDHFESVMGRMPDFIDGHQHVHQLPIVRKALIAVYLKKIAITQAQRPWIRISNQKDDAALPYLLRLKAWFIRCLGSGALSQLLQVHQIHCPQPFAGVYGLHMKQAKCLLPHFISQLSGRGLLMCHPAKYTHPNLSPIEMNRMKEYHWLKDRSHGDQDKL